MDAESPHVEEPGRNGALTFATRLRGRLRPRMLWPLALVVALAGLPAIVRGAILLTSGTSRGASAAAGAAPRSNPCLGPQAATLLCPNLVIEPPTDLRLERTRGGHVLLRAISAIDNVGDGPLQIVAQRTAPDAMSASQQIERVGGGWLTVPTGGQVVFTLIPGQYGYWKFGDAAVFELWSLDALGRRAKLLRVGPKRQYCLRDLYRTYPSPRSPPRRRYPGCSNDRGATSVTLGTSVGWSDDYPAEYYQQWIDVTGLHGRFAYYMVADPLDHIYESNELDNSSETLVTIP